jgi:hypothetical protein
VTKWETVSGQFEGYSSTSLTVAGLIWCLVGTLRHHLLPMVRVDALVSAKIRCVHSLSQRYRAILAASHRTPPSDTPPVVRAEAAHPLGASARFSDADLDRRQAQIVE